jgi:hypothetical protein
VSRTSIIARNGLLVVTGSNIRWKLTHRPTIRVFFSSACQSTGESTVKIPTLDQTAEKKQQKNFQAERGVSRATKNG